MFAARSDGPFYDKQLLSYIFPVIYFHIVFLSLSLVGLKFYIKQNWLSQFSFFHLPTITLSTHIHFQAHAIQTWTNNMKTMHDNSRQNIKFEFATKCYKKLVQTSLTRLFFLSLPLSFTLSHLYSFDFEDIKIAILPTKYKQ